MRAYVDGWKGGRVNVKYDRQMKEKRVENARDGRVDGGMEC